MPDGPDLNSRQYFQRRLGGLEIERESFDNHWKEIAQHIKPRRGRFFLDDVNDGRKLHQSIINSRATQALKISRAGLLAGTMSPSRPWMALRTPDPAMMEFQPVKIWLKQVQDILFRIWADSNLYSQASICLEEMLLFATGVMTHVDDFEDVARFYAHTVGSYFVAQSDRQVIHTLFREFMMTAQQIVAQFGLENASQSVRTAWDRSRYDQWFPVIQAIEPNPDFRPGNPLSKFKAYRSVYFEHHSIRGAGDRTGTPVGSLNSSERFLQFAGFDEFPAYVPRWDTTDGDIYGTDCPGMTTLGDVKQLQIQEKRKAQGIDKMVSPPLNAPASYKHVNIDNLPGGTTIAGEENAQNTLKPVYQVNPQLGEMRLDIDAVQKRIDEAFFVDMFLAISQIEGIQPRNQADLLMRNEERLLQLGPVLEHLHGEFLAKLVDRTFNQAVRANILPPAPPELSEVALKVRFTSTLALAQQAAQTQTLDRFVAFAGSLASVGFEAALQKFDADQAMDEYADALGVTPTVVVPDEIVQERRAADARRAAAQNQLEAASQAANTAKMLSDAKTGDPSALTAVAGNA